MKQVKLFSLDENKRINNLHYVMGEKDDSYVLYGGIIVDKKTLQDSHGTYYVPYTQSYALMFYRNLMNDFIKLKEEFRKSWEFLISYGRPYVRIDNEAFSEDVNRVLNDMNSIYEDLCLPKEEDL